MFLETVDGVAILAYAGLGATARGTEPADWMSAVLRNRNWPIEPSLRILATALKREFPPHLRDLRGVDGPQHNVVVAAFVEEEARLYSIDLALSVDRSSSFFRHTRWITPIRPGVSITPRIALAGSGATILLRDSTWQRPLLRAVAAHDRGQISALRVADDLATLSCGVSAAITDRSVGPRSIVAWRYRKAGVRGGGGGHQYYTECKRDSQNSSLPSISRGMDTHALIEAMMPLLSAHMQAVLHRAVHQELNVTEINAALAQMPEDPDERLS